MASLEKAWHTHHVHGAGFQVLRLTLLAQRAEAFVVVDPGTIWLPQEIVKGDHRQGCIGLLIQERLHRAVDIFDQR